MSLASAMQSVRPGVWRWTAPHPDWSPWDPKSKTGFGWPQQVGSVCYETPDQLVLIDPLAPPSSTPAHQQFWQALDETVQARQQPVAVLLSTDWHERSAQAVFDRYVQQFGASIWIHEAAPQDSLECRPTHYFSRRRVARRRGASALHSIATSGGCVLPRFGANSRGSRCALEYSGRTNLDWEP